MANTPTKKTTTADPTQLPAVEYRAFIEHFPNHFLREANIKRPSFYAVGQALAVARVDFNTGTGIRVSQTALADITGADPRTVKKVLDLLKEKGALVVVDHQRRPGKPSENFRFNRSEFVSMVLSEENRHWEPQTAKNASHPGHPGSSAGDPGSSAGHPGSSAYNKSIKSSKSSNEESPSSPLPSAGDRLLEDVWNLNPHPSREADFEKLLAGL